MDGGRECGRFTITRSAGTCLGFITSRHLYVRSDSTRVSELSGRLPTQAMINQIQHGGLKGGDQSEDR